jgi:hypothetical protein
MQLGRWDPYDGSKGEIMSRRKIFVGVLGVAALALAASPGFAAAPVGSPNGTIAGYAGGVGPTATTTFRFTVPTISCAGVTVPVYVNLGAYGVLKGNSAGATVGLRLQCAGGVPAMSANVGTGSRSATIDVTAGDVLSASEAVTATHASVRLRDLTTAMTAKVAGKGFTVQAVDATLQPLQPTGWPSFSPLTFSKIKVNGQPYSALSPTGYYLVDGSNHTEITISKLVKKGTAFTYTWVAGS